MPMTNPTKVITRPVLWKDFNAFDPNEETGLYEITLVIRKDDEEDLSKISYAMKSSHEQSPLGFNGIKKQPFETVKLPIIDGDEDGLYPGCYHIHAVSGTAPGIVDSERWPIIDKNILQDGDIGRASIIFIFDIECNAILCRLNNLQLIEEGGNL